jgi:hypothetical protein
MRLSAVFPCDAATLPELLVKLELAQEVASNEHKFALGQR